MERAASSHLERHKKQRAKWVVRRRCLPVRALPERLHRGLGRVAKASGACTGELCVRH
jgi:hypothetical protein